MIEFHPRAAEELRQALTWYRARSLRAAERFVQQTIRAVTRLMADPRSYPVIAKGFHYVRVSKFLFVLVYQVRGANDVFVVALAHTSRRSAYWRGRT